MPFDLTPAHLHLVLNHIPIIGLAFASLPIVIGILAQSRTTIAAGLLATLLCAGSIPTIIQTGREASHSFKEGKTLPPLDEEGRIALHMHSERAHKTTPFVYASALLALLALLALIKFSQVGLWLSSAVLLGNAISISLAIWTAQAGGLIRHLELRPHTSLETHVTTPTANIIPATVISSTNTPTITPVNGTNSLPAIATPGAAPTTTP